MPGAQKHNTDNLDELAAVLDGRKVLALAGHTHTVENIEPGEYFEGWQETTNVAGSPFHQIVAGALSGSWWAGDLNDGNVPHATQRLGAPRGYFQLDFDGSDYTDTYKVFGKDDTEQLHASFSTPRFRDWAQRLLDYRALYGRSFDQVPPVVLRDLGDMNMLTQADLAEGTWAAVNVWNGSKASSVSVSINGGAAIAATRTQKGEGEAKLKGVDYADPYAMAKQSTQGSVAARSVDGGDATAGFTTWSGAPWQGHAGPFQGWMLTDNSQHLWTADLPTDLPVGAHTMTVTTTDRYGRQFSSVIPFEVVAELPNMDWQAELWD